MAKKVDLRHPQAAWTIAQLSWRSRFVLVRRSLWVPLTALGGPVSAALNWKVLGSCEVLRIYRSIFRFLLICLLFVRLSERSLLTFRFHRWLGDRKPIRLVIQAKPSKEMGLRKKGWIRSESLFIFFTERRKKSYWLRQNEQAVRIRYYI